MSMDASNAAVENGERLVEAEWDAGIARSAAFLARKASKSCVECGEDIGEERRKAAPFARRCIDCQTVFEHETRRV